MGQNLVNIDKIFDPSTRDSNMQLLCRRVPSRAVSVGIETLRCHGGDDNENVKKAIC